MTDVMGTDFGQTFEISRVKNSLKLIVRVVARVRHNVNRKIDAGDFAGSGKAAQENKARAGATL